MLVQLAKMRKKMKKEHPGMLEKMRDKISQSQGKSKPITKPKLSPDVNLDQNKNIQTIEKMLDLKTENPGFEKAVKAILSKKS
ncbi:MAG: hypothetical protein AB8B83_06440 [Bdellovibrionales bacterium]